VGRQTCPGSRSQTRQRGRIKRGNQTITHARATVTEGGRRTRKARLFRVDNKSVTNPGGNYQVGEATRKKGKPRSRTPTLRITGHRKGTSDGGNIAKKNTKKKRHRRMRGKKEERFLKKKKREKTTLEESGVLR